MHLMGAQATDRRTRPDHPSLLHLSRRPATRLRGSAPAFLHRCSSCTAPVRVPADGTNLRRSMEDQAVAAEATEEAIEAEGQTAPAERAAAGPDAEPESPAGPSEGAGPEGRATPE